MPRNFWTQVNGVIREADILLLVLDSRLPEETRNKEIEAKIKREKKKILYVFNKCDLISDERAKKLNSLYSPSVFISATKHLGTTILRNEIMRIAKGEAVKVGVLGYPNTGKSSLINSLCRGKAGVAPISGYTKGVQLVRSTAKLLFVDTPGVIPFQEEDEIKHLLIGTRNPDQAKEPEDAAASLLEGNMEKVEEWYSLVPEAEEDGYDLLERIGESLNYKKKGGDTDLRRTSIKILFDWQKGKII